MHDLFALLISAPFVPILTIAEIAQPRCTGAFSSSASQVKDRSLVVGEDDVDVFAPVRAGNSEV